MPCSTARRLRDDAPIDPTLSMNAYSRPHDTALPTLSAQWVRLWLEKTQDLVLLLDAADQIVGVFQSESFEKTEAYHWIGQDLARIVSAESRPKLPLLLDNDAALDSGDPRWRHLNLLGRHEQVFPVLARFMSWPGDGPVKAIFCRDLRPLQEANDRFLLAQQELEARNQSLQARLQHQDREGSAFAGLHTDQLVRTIKETSYAQAIQETVHHIEKQCLQALLADAGGNNAKAAEMAGLALSEWLEKLASVQRGSV